MTVRQLRLRIYEIVRPLLRKKRQNITMDELTREYDAVFDKSGEYRVNNSLYDLEIHNNLPVQSSGFFSGERKVRCDICRQEHKDNCMFAFNDDVTLEEVLSVRSYERDLELTVNFKSDAQVELNKWENPSYDVVNLNAPTQFDVKSAKNAGLETHSSD